MTDLTWSEMTTSQRLACVIFTPIAFTCYQITRVCIVGCRLMGLRL